MTTRAASPHPTKHPATNQRRVDRSRRPALLGGIAVGAIVLVAAAVAFALRPSGHATGSPPAINTVGVLPGVAESPPPWAPEYANLPARLRALNMPSPGQERYHIHAHLTVYVNGAAVPIPADVGMDEVHGVASAMHTHEADGVIHIEADAASNVFTLGSFFDVWGVALSPSRLGSFAGSGTQGVRLYVNGRKVNDPDTYLLKPHDNLVLAYGTDDSFPHTVAFTWPPGE